MAGLLLLPWFYFRSEREDVIYFVCIQLSRGQQGHFERKGDTGLHD